MKKIITITFLYFYSALCISAPSTPECVNIYFDKGPDKYWIGRTYSVYLQNLMGHFPELQQIVSPIDNYKKGDIEKCRATIYVGSHYDSKIPDDFYADYINTQKNVAWLGYNIWRKPELAQVFGYKYTALTQLDRGHLDYLGKPTFFKWVDYKGERFHKFGDWSTSDPSTFLSAFEMIELTPQNLVSNDTQVLATCTHNGIDKTIPYILRNKNHFYVADVVFSFMHEADRYMIFTDVLFDILNLPPRHAKKYAAMRIEDVNSMMPLHLLHTFSDTLTAHNVPINVSIIPFFFDPFNLAGRAPNQEFVGVSQNVSFVQWIKEIQAKNARFIWHGITHQYERIHNPFSGISGADFEFWDANNNKPVEKDSPSWLLNRMYDGFYELNKIGIKPMIWLTPHYQASTLDNILFGHVMPWTMGRVIYNNYNLTSPPITRSNSHWFTDTNIDTQKKRIQDLSNIEYTITSPWWNGQIFPYEIYGDIHGQRILPENLGNSQPFKNAFVVRPRSVQEMVADAKRNLVLRDVWASYFYHPFLFNSYDNGGRGQFTGDPSELVYLITEIKKMGYEFIDLENFAKDNVKYYRPEPIYNLEP